MPSIKWHRSHTQFMLKNPTYLFATTGIIKNTI